MNEYRLPNYLRHMREAATNAHNFVDGMKREDFLADKRAQQAVIMSLVILGEVATKIMDRSFRHDRPRRASPSQP